jgi:hypothetical protein
MAEFGSCCDDLHKALTPNFEPFLRVDADNGGEALNLRHVNGFSRYRAWQTEHGRLDQLRGPSIVGSLGGNGKIVAVTRLRS